MASKIKSSNVHSQTMQEEAQGPDTRKHIFSDIEKEIGRPLVSFFTSFDYAASIDDEDADMIQSVLRHLDLSNGLALLINSPGGDGLAAERIINICRSYSGTNEYWAVVAGKAKSAATMVCMGASKIMMAPMSELGPVDPQILKIEDGMRKVFSAHSLVITYDKLFKGATQTKGNLQPYIQQLSYFDIRDINKYRSLIDLADNIAVKTLKNGMMKGKTEDSIKKSIKVFLDPSAGTLAHGRPIYLEEAKGSGLIIDEIDVKNALWELIYELYVRTDRFVSRGASKAVESSQESFHFPPRT